MPPWRRGRQPRRRCSQRARQFDSRAWSCRTHHTHHHCYQTFNAWAPRSTGAAVPLAEDLYPVRAADPSAESSSDAVALG